MKTETKLKSGLVMSLLGLITMSMFYFQQKDDLQKCKDGQDFFLGGDIEKQELINQRDSLQSELFVTEVQLNRYQIALELFKEKNKTGADEFELILTTQTE
jgi:hypothetical protein